MPKQAPQRLPKEGQKRPKIDFLDLLCKTSIPEAILKARWQGCRKHLDTPRQAEGLRRRVYATALRRNPFQDSPKGIPPRTCYGRCATAPLKWSPELSIARQVHKIGFGPTFGLPWGVFVVPVGAPWLARGGIGGHLAAYFLRFWPMLFAALVLRPSQSEKVMIWGLLFVLKT